MRLVSKATIFVFIAHLAPGIAWAEPETENTVRIAGSIYLGDLPTWVARDRGFFAAQGLDAAVEFGNSGRQNMASLRAGGTDFALMALTPILLDRLADVDPGEPDDPVIISSLLQSFELMAVVTSSDRGIAQPADFRGRRVAVAPGTDAEFAWWMFEQFHGLESSSVRKVPVAFSEMPEALTARRVDAAIMPEPWGSQFEARTGSNGADAVRRFDLRDVYAGRWVIVTTRATVKNRPDACRRVLAAYREAVEFIARRTGDAFAIYMRSANAAEEMVPDHWQSLDFDLDLDLNLDWSLVASLQQQLRWAREVGYDMTDGALSVLDMIDPGPLHKAWPQAVGIPLRGGSGR